MVRLHQSTSPSLTLSFLKLRSEYQSCSSTLICFSSLHWVHTHPHSSWERGVEHVSVFLQGCATYTSGNQVRSSPGRQWHWYPLIRSWQMPPWKQGFEQHSFMSSSQKSPVKPAGHLKHKEMLPLKLKKKKCEF